MSRHALAWALVLSGLASAAVAAERVVEEVTIIVVDDKDKSPAKAPVAATSAPTYRPAARDENYQIFWDHPDQVYVDSDVGPIPLYTEVTTDAQGRPVPRFPDNIFAKQFLDNPTKGNALLYLESQRVRARRYIQASTVMAQVSKEAGYVNPDDFRPPTVDNNQARAIVAPTGVTDESLGNPVLGPQGALLAGVAKEDIPRTPGVTTTRDVEVVFVWDHRCAWSMRAWPEFGRVGKEVFERQLGPRFLSVSMDNDSPTVQSRLEYLDWAYEKLTKFTENYIDQTDLRASMRIGKTPTFLFFDRRTSKILRLEGFQTAEKLQATLMELVGRDARDWASADPRWFRPVKPAPGTGKDSQTQSSVDAGDDASPVMPPSRTIRAWDPSGAAPD